MYTPDVGNIIVPSNIPPFTSSSIGHLGTLLEDGFDNFVIEKGTRVQLLNQILHDATLAALPAVVPEVPGAITAADVSGPVSLFVSTTAGTE